MLGTERVMPCDWRDSLEQVKGLLVTIYLVAVEESGMQDGVSNHRGGFYGSAIQASSGAMPLKCEAMA
jgi:hypothetical protein